MTKEKKILRVVLFLLPLCCYSYDASGKAFTVDVEGRIAQGESVRVELDDEDEKRSLLPEGMSNLTSSDEILDPPSCLADLGGLPLATNPFQEVPGRATVFGTTTVSNTFSTEVRHALSTDYALLRQKPTDNLLRRVLAPTKFRIKFKFFNYDGAGIHGAGWYQRGEKTEVTRPEDIARSWLAKPSYLIHLNANHKRQITKALNAVKSEGGPGLAQMYDAFAVPKGMIPSEYLAQAIDDSSIPQEVTAKSAFVKCLEQNSWMKLHDKQNEAGQIILGESTLQVKYKLKSGTLEVNGENRTSSYRDLPFFMLFTTA